MRLHGIIGGPLDQDGSLRGAVGAVVRSATDVRILTAGHVALRAGARLKIRGLGGGEVESVRMSDTVDAAILRPFVTLPPSSATLPDGARLSAVRDAAPGLVGEECFFHDVESGERFSVRVRHVNAEARVHYPGDDAETLVRGLIATDGVLREGDSGTVLYDRRFRALGTLMGSVRDLNYFVPLGVSLPALGVRFI